MKRLIFCCCLLFTLIFLWGCSDKALSETLPDTSLIEVNTVYDKYDNILQQVFYNKTSNEYILKEYTYIYQDPKWVCTNQTTKIISNNTSTKSDNKPLLTIYYNSDLADGPIPIMNNEYVKIEIVKYLAKDDWYEFGYELKAVNKTNSVITFTLDNMSIMDIACKPLFSIDHVNAGDTAYFTLGWDKDTLERCYIPYIDNIEFELKIFDNEDWTVPALCGERILIKQ